MTIRVSKPIVVALTKGYSVTRSFALTRPSETLTPSYDKIADRWQGMIAKLGFPGAYAHLFDQAELRTCRHILDLGTGSGEFASAALNSFTRRPKALTLLDTSEEMLRVAAHRFADLRPQTLCAPVGTETIAKETQDIILGAHIFEHLSDPEAAFRWAFERLRPGGRICLAVSRPHWCTALIRWRWGHAAWKPNTVQAMLSSAGFDQIRHIPFPLGPPSRTSAGYTARKPIE